MNGKCTRNQVKMYYYNTKEYINNQVTKARPQIYKQSLFIYPWARYTLRWIFCGLPWEQWWVHCYLPMLPLISLSDSWWIWASAISFIFQNLMLFLDYRLISYKIQKKSVIEINFKFCKIKTLHILMTTLIIRLFHLSIAWYQFNCPRVVFCCFF